MDSTQVLLAVFEFVLLIFSLCVHECAHAWMASRLGDQTARMQGRVTLNPISHIDPIGTLLFPALMIFGSLVPGGGGMFLIGWAKPTPVITRNFKNIRRDDNLVTLAGPVSNLLIAFVAFLVLVVIAVTPGSVTQGETLGNHIDGLANICFVAIEINIALFIFNLLPIPPLDGSHILRHYLPYNALKAYDSMGFFSYILMFIVGRPVVSFFLGPAMRMVQLALNHIAVP